MGKIFKAKFSGIWLIREMYSTAALLGKEKKKQWDMWRGKMGLFTDGIIGISAANLIKEVS